MTNKTVIMDDTIDIETIKKVKFNILSDEITEKLSNVGIIKSHLYTNNIPTEAGPYDLHLGSTDNDMVCLTCNYKKKQCLGHGGYYLLKYPHIKPIFFNYMKKILKIFCPFCSALQHPKNVVQSIKKMNYDNDTIIQKLIELKKNEKCISCKKQLLNYVKHNEKDLFIYYSNNNENDKNDKKILYTHLIETMLNNIKPSDLELLNISIDNHPKNIITRYFYIPPNQIRPDLRLVCTDKVINDQITSYIQLIIKINETIVPVTQDSVDIEQNNLEKIKNLNAYIVSLLIGGQQINNGYSGKTIHINNFKPILERFKSKEGLIRKNILGRRVHGMFRGVIICDPTLPLDYIRIPVKFAKKMTIEETVTDLNKDRLMRFVKNGIYNYPGAEKYIKKSNNRKYSLIFARDIVLENGDIVYRDLIDGDIIYFNRQPSLTYSSICAVKIVVDTNPNFYSIGMNVLICKYFGADFDGDQMNGIVLNTTTSRNEALMLGGIQEFVMSKQFSTIHLGQSYDSVIGCFLTTREDVKLNKRNASRILSSIKNINSYYIDRLFHYFNNNEFISGKKLMSVTIPEKISINCKSEWYNPDYEKIYKYNENEKYVKITNGEIISGVLDKATIGEGGLPNSIYNLINNEYGNYKTIDVIYDMQQISLNYTLYEGFSLGINDVMVGNDNISEIREKLLHNILTNLNELKNKVLTNDFIVPIGVTKLKHFENKYIEDGAMKYINIGKYVDPNTNNLLKLAMSGSKGKLNQMFEMLATIGLKLMNGANLLSNNKFTYFRTSPYYQRFDLSPESKGFISNSYFTGTNVSEYLVMTMSGRHDIIVKALLTANAGDQNRKSVKNLESVSVNNIRLIKNNNHIIQYIYGYNSIDCSKTIKHNLKSIFMMPFDDFKKEFYYKDQNEFDKLVKFKEKIANISIQYSYINILSNLPDDTFKFNIPFHIDLILKNHSKNSSESDSNIKTMINKVNEFCENLKYLYFNKQSKDNKIYIPEIYESSMFIIEFVIRIYLSSKYIIKYNIHLNDIDNILDIIELKIIKSFIQPGNPIGILTAQCISEPMTQNALDTHRGAAMEGKRKSGMKRIKEILGAKKPDKIDDLTMTFILKNNLKYDKEINEKIAHNITMLKLNEFISLFQIFYEQPLHIIHPDYLHEQKLINKFVNYNKGYAPPKNLSKFNVRLVVNKLYLFNKKITLNEVIAKLKNELRGSYVVYSDENSQEIIIRIYISENFIEKKNKTNLSLIKQQLNNILNINIIGIPGIMSAKVSEITSKLTYVNNEFKPNKHYIITTFGVNLYDIYLIPEIDHDYIQTDDIVSYSMIYGIEAVKAKISYELKDLIDDKINFKHYLLTADNMTRHGVLTSFEKPGLNKREKNNILLRLGTSHPRQILEEAAINNKECSTAGLTPSLMVGASPNSFGTCYNDIYIDTVNLKKIVNNLYK
jgi:DNA-directed RNA polymerase II subunit RPB1